MAGEHIEPARIKFLFVQMVCASCVCESIDCGLKSLGAILSCPGATPKHISQGAIRNLITALNCSLSASLLHSVHFPFFPLFSPFLLSFSLSELFLKLCIHLSLHLPLSLSLSLVALFLSFVCFASFLPALAGLAKMPAGTVLMC